MLEIRIDSATRLKPAERGINIQELAHMTGLAESTISQIRTGSLPEHEVNRPSPGWMRNRR